MFLSWSADVHVVRIYSSDYSLSILSQVELSHFQVFFLLFKSMDSGYLVCATPPKVLC